MAHGEVDFLQILLAMRRLSWSGMDDKDDKENVDETLIDLDPNSSVNDEELSNGTTA